MSGGSKLFKKKDRSLNLFNRVNSHFFSLVNSASKETYYALDVRALQVRTDDAKDRAQ